MASNILSMQPLVELSGVTKVYGSGLAVKSCLDMSSDLLSGNVVNVMPGFKPKLLNYGLSARADNRLHRLSGFSEILSERSVQVC